ncbi:MAG: HIT family protein [Anaerolineales bacterium]
MKRLFSPWRKPYIERDKAGEKSKGCVFCEALKVEDGPENLIIHRGKTAFVMLNRFPYTNGHLMVLPFAHVSELNQVDAPARAEMMELLNQAVLVLGQVFKAEGYNLGANLGAAAGAGIEEHLHLHAMPRWLGDTNFMATVGETRVLPETLEETWRKLREAWISPG